MNRSDVEDKLDWVYYAVTPEVLRLEIARAQRRYYEISPRRHVRRALERASKGWAVEDTFDFDGYMAKVIHGGVIQIRANLHGHPMEFDDAPDPMFAWADILDRIIHGFWLYLEDRWWQAEDKDAAWEEIEDARRLYARWFGNLWD